MQQFNDSPEGQFVRRLLGMFDEYQSIETSKHVTRSLHENAIQGFWNGGTTPFGYRIVEVEKRDKTSKKDLAPEEEDTALMRQIFSRFLEGDGKQGPMGIKAIINWLNERGYRTRGGKKWGVSVLHRMLRDAVYAGNFVFKSSQNCGADVSIPVPAIIEKPEFDTIQQIVTDRNPKKIHLGS